MTALPRHRHSPKGPKITRISHQYIKDRKKTSKLLVEEPQEQISQPQAQPPQTAQRQGSYGYAPAQPAQQPVQQPVQQPQQGIPGWWMTVVIVILAIFAFIFFFNLAKAILPNIGTGVGSNCITSCEGYVVVQAPGCDCPSGSHLSPTTPYAYNNAECKGGCKQCICR